jgi:predicted transcriptional regulator
MYLHTCNTSNNAHQNNTNRQQQRKMATKEGNAQQNNGKRTDHEQNGNGNGTAINKNGRPATAAVTT